MGAVETMEAGENLGPLLERVQGGREVVLTRNGIPVARIIPADPWDREKVGAAISQLRQLRKGVRREGLSIKSLIEEGRR